MSNRGLLQEELESEFGELKKMAVGSDEYKVAVDGVTKLLDRSIEMERLEIESQEKVKARESEETLKREQMEEEKKDRKIKNLIAVGGILIPAALTAWGTIKTINFEQDGYVSTIIGRGFINKLLPKK